MLIPCTVHVPTPHLVHTVCADVSAGTARKNSVHASQEQCGRVGMVGKEWEGGWKGVRRRGEWVVKIRVGGRRGMVVGEMGDGWWWVRG
jgi:hypothetical protein